MNRRSFLTALFGGVAASAAGAVVTSQAVKAMEIPAAAAAAIDETPAEFAQYYRRPRPRRQVCTIRRGRFDRPVRVCRWV